MSPRAPAGPTRGWTITASYGKTGTRRVTRPRGIWPEGPGWSRLRALTHQRPRRDWLYLRSTPIATGGKSGSLVTRPEFRSFWRSPTMVNMVSRGQLARRVSSRPRGRQLEQVVGGGDQGG